MSDPTFTHDEGCDWSRGNRPRCEQRPTAHVGDIYYACEDHFEEFRAWLQEHQRFTEWLCE